MDAPVSPLLSFRQAADFVGVTPGTVWRWHVSGWRGRRLRAVRTPRGYRTRESWLLAFLEEEAEQAEPSVRLGLRRVL